jgi:hypothetical protein
MCLQPWYLFCVTWAMVGLPASLRGQVDSYFDSGAGPNGRSVLNVYEIRPGTAVRRLRSYELGVLGLSGDLSPILIDPRSGEFWSVSQIRFPIHFRRYEFQGSQIVATQDVIEVPWISTAAGADFDDDGYLVVCTHSGGVHTIDFLGRRILRSHQLQAGGVHWYMPAARGSLAIAEFETSVPSPRTVIAHFDAQGAFVRNLRVELNPIYPTSYQLARGAVTTSNGRVFIAGQFPPVLELYEVVGTSMVRRTEINRAVGNIFEDASRGVLHIPMGLQNGQNRCELDLHTNTYRFSYDQYFPNDVPRFNLGFFPGRRLQLSPTRPSASETFDAVFALGGNPSDLGLVLFRHARVGGIPLLELNSLVALSPFDANGLQRTVMRYDPALFGLQAGDELWFQGFGWNGNSLWSTPEQVIRWR